MNDVVGSLYYIAPEIFDKEYDEKVDLSICKMIMDGHIEIEELSDSIH